MKQIDYDPGEHIYKVDGIKRDSVNQILKAMGAIPDFNFPNAEYKRQLGGYVHSAIQLYFENRLDEDSLMGDVKSYFNGFKKFMEENPITPLEVEKHLYSERHNFCGTPDFFTADTLYDIKCSSVIYPHYSLSLSAYELLVEEYLGTPENIFEENTFIIKLMPNEYKLIPVEEDRQSFLAMVYAYRWLKKNKMLDSL